MSNRRVRSSRGGRRSVRVRWSAVFAILAMALLVRPLGAQDWKASALASFDTAWQTINDTFVDPSFAGLDWAAVRAELRPKVAAAQSLDEVRALITDMLQRLHRSHFVLIPGSASAANPALGAATVPIDVRIVDAPDAGLAPGPYALVTHVDPESSAARAGITAGDVLLRVDDVGLLPTDEAPSTGDPRVDVLNRWRRVEHALHGDAGTRAALTIDDGAGRRTVDVERTDEPGETVTLGNLPPLDVQVDHRLVTTPAGRHLGYIRFNVWLTQVDAPVAAAVDEYRDADGLIIDLRGNPGGLAGMMMGIAGHLFDTPALLGTMHTRTYTLELRANPRRSTADGRAVTPYAGPVALLVDGLSGSTSECFAAALQSLGRARVIGRPTMGEALPASTARLPDGDVLMYAIGDFVTSTGVRVEGGGVQPDQTVSLTSAALRGGRDPDVDAAAAWIDRLGVGRQSLLDSGDLRTVPFLPRKGRL